ncbi:AAA family ATPase [Burkholderia stabilis]|uniref:AAA family ATPase n=1 Tax=Burkholderia stabilis TaxID=95485 RepID=UPI0013E9887F|nr:AAA family ATPase [Burkholderia stabilis]
MQLFYKLYNWGFLMVLLREFSLPFNPDRAVKLNRGRQNNRISVLLGINGTQKSSILRGILEGALFAASASDVTSNMKRSLECNAKWHAAVPDKVIAISSAATDRFPSKTSFGEGGFFTKYDIPKYTYVGPRTGRNIVSRAQSVQSLLSEFLQTASISPSVGKFIDRLSVKTSVPFTITLRLKRRQFDPGRIRPPRASSLSTFLAETGANPHLTRSSRWTKLVEEAKKDRALMKESTRFFDLLNTEEFKRGIEIEIDLRSSGYVGLPQIDPRAIHFGLIVGFVKLSDIEFRAPGLPPVHPDTFSAGQWGLFSSLTTAALGVRDRTLLLIDEPENALHPSWQREYLAELRLAFSHCKNCHIIIATHSPLIVSGLGAKEADLIGLRLANDRSVVPAPLEVPMGWQVTDVLEDIFDLPSTRSPGVVSDIETAMKLITKGVDQNIVALRKVAKRLTTLLNSLPEDDVARQVISSICRISGVTD